MREMKDSGIEWIGKVPVEWKIDNPQYHFSQRKDRAKQGMVQLTASQKYGVITQTEYMERTGANIVTVQKDLVSNRPNWIVWLPEIKRMLQLSSKLPVKLSPEIM